MKKFLAMLLALVMALSLVACGEKKDPTGDDTKNPDEGSRVRPSSAPRSPLIWWTPAATSSLPTASVMSLT